MLHAYGRTLLAVGLGAMLIALGPRSSAADEPSTRHYTYEEERVVVEQVPVERIVETIRERPGTRIDTTVESAPMTERRDTLAEAVPVIERRETIVETMPVIERKVIERETVVEAIPAAPVIERRTTVETVPAAPVIERRVIETIERVN